MIVGEPLCDFGRGPECVAGPFIRTDDFPRIAVNRANGDLFVVWQDFRNNEYDNSPVELETYLLKDSYHDYCAHPKTIAND